MTQEFIFKFSGIVLILVSGYEATVSYKNSLSEALLYANDALLFVKHARDSIYYKELPVSKIIESYEPKLTKTAEFYGRAAKDPTLAIEVPQQYDEKTRSIMKEFYSSLGRSYRDSEITLCEETEKKLSAHISELTAGIKSKNRIFRAVTLFFAASVILILI